MPKLDFKLFPHNYLNPFGPLKHSLCPLLYNVDCCVCLLVCLPVHPSICLCLFISLFVLYVFRLSDCQSVFRSAYLLVHLSVPVYLLASLCMCSIYLSVSLPACLPVHLSVPAFVCSVYLSVYLPAHPSVCACLSACLSLYVFCLPVHLSVPVYLLACLCVCSVYLSVCLPACPSNHLSVCAYLSACLPLCVTSVCLSVCPFATHLVSVPVRHQLSHSRGWRVRTANGRLSIDIKF